MKDAATLREDEKTQDAVVRTIEIIGEAAERIQKIAPVFVAANAEMPRVEMRGMRNKVIQKYFDVDWDLVWRTVHGDLPVLKGMAAGLLALAAKRKAVRAKSNASKYAVTVAFGASQQLQIHS